VTPAAFIAKWRPVELKERSTAQTHFNDLCALLGLDDPIAADPKGDWFTFEKGASKTTGGEGWADVWRKGCFGWEYKGRHKDLEAANRQLLNYAVALENPPLLVTCDTDRIVIRTNFTNTVQETHTLLLDDLLDGAKRDLLRAAFTEPDRLRPRRTRDALTAEAATKFSLLALRLRERGQDAQTVAHFVNRLVFCMFAEDVGLLPDRLFQKMLEASRPAPGDFAGHAATLFAAMKDGGRVGFTAVEWFNGGLFDDAAALPLAKLDIDDLLEAARLDWSQIDPSILGTLFERGLDPGKRSQLGAHYTDRDKIMKIVNPVIVEPLLAEWAGTKAQIEAALAREKTAGSAAAATRVHNQAVELRTAFLERLRAFRVLDPACGSGNFLYLSLRALKDIEHRVNVEGEALGLPRSFPQVGPEAVRGIELNPYAAELARISVWIGEIQWMRANGFDASKNPILRPLDTIECRDAILNEDGTRAEWPEADVVVGNPPFLGGKLMRDNLGDAYVDALFQAWKSLVRPEADLVMYWFAMCGWLLRKGMLRAGLVATNSIRGGANRAVLERAMVGGTRIFDAWDDEEWTIEGAAVRVSLVCMDSDESPRLPRLDGMEVEEIHTDLTARGVGSAAVDLTKAARLDQNRDVTFQGSIKTGPFELTGDEARAMVALPINPNGRPNSDVLRPWRNGLDITRRLADLWIIDFGSAMDEPRAALFEAPFTELRKRVDRENDLRAGTGRPPLRGRERRSLEGWWLHQRPREEMRQALKELTRYIATARVAKYRLFVWLLPSVLPDCQLIVIARDDDTTLGILHSRFHELWSLRMGTSLEDRPRYTPSTTFETFPFPEGLTPDIPAADYAGDPRAQAIAAAAAELNAKREAWLNPADLVVRVPEVVAGYPDRVLPKDDAAAAVLKTRTLTNLYNQRPAWLDHAHARLDAAVAEAYGWGDDWRAGKLGEEAILARLFALNRARAATSAADP
jgi:hypothetical protein